LIIGKRIRLRGVERKDLPLFVEWLNDPEVIKGLSINLPLSSKDEEGWFEKLSELPPEEKPLAIEIKEGNTWRLIGNSSLFNISLINRCAEVGIFIGDKKEWGKGYGTETMLLLLKHGFGTLNLHRIFLRVYENNPQAIRTYEKVGFKHEGRLREDRYYQGNYYDTLIMSMLRNEWLSRETPED
jgi:RimJ/RimL family protein N-acetyltransferase